MEQIMDVLIYLQIVKNILLKINVKKQYLMKIVFGINFINNAISKLVKMKYLKVKNALIIFLLVLNHNINVEILFVKIIILIMMKNVRYRILNVHQMVDFVYKEEHVIKININKLAILILIIDIVVGILLKNNAVIYNVKRHQLN